MNIYVLCEFDLSGINDIDGVYSDTEQLYVACQIALASNLIYDSDDDQRKKLSEEDIKDEFNRTNPLSVYSDVGAKFLIYKCQLNALPRD
ncbi:MAG: hypothetical protein AAF620_01050 [Bacteroidota bacterium]